MACGSESSRCSSQIKRNPKYPGRPRLDDRKVLNGILLVLYTGIRREFLLRDWATARGCGPARARRTAFNPTTVCAHLDRCRSHSRTLS